MFEKIMDFSDYCGLCLKDMEKTKLHILRPCDHEFCKNCITSFTLCPYCRFRIMAISLNRIYQPKIRARDRRRKSIANGQ